MQSFFFAAGDTSKTIDIFLPNSSSTTGAGLTGLVFNTASLIAYYRIAPTGSATAITLATQTVGGAFSSGGFVEIDATHMPGMYRFDIPNAVLASQGTATVYFSGATNLAVVPVQINIGVPTGADMGQALPTAPVANSVGEALFLADILGGRFGTAQAGASTTITLDAGASSIDGRYVGYGVYLYGGTGGGVRGTGQDRTIVAYNGTTKVATVAQAWGTNPDNTSKFMLLVQPWANVGMWNGTVVATPATAGIPDVNAKNWNNLATVALPLTPTVAGRTLDVSAGGEAGLDWANVGSPTTTLALTGTTIAVTQKVDVDTIKTNPVVNAGTITFPTTATLASTSNITAGTITTATNLTNAPTAGDFTATMKTSIGTAVAASTVASVTGNVGGNVVGSVGSISGVTFPTNFGSLSIGGTGHITNVDTLTTYTGDTPQTGDSFARIGAAGVGLTAVALTGTQTFSNTGTWTGNIVGTLSTLTTYTGNTPQTGDSFARIGATGSGLTSLAPSSTALSTATWTGALATNLGTLASHDPGGTLASSANQTTINSNVLTTPAAIWDLATSGHTTAGTFGAALVAAGGYAFPANFSALLISGAGHISNVDTLTTYTGNTPQTGDSFARIGATGSGLTSLAPSATAISNVQWTNALATALGTLSSHDPGSTLAAASAVAALPTAVQNADALIGRNIAGGSSTGRTVKQALAVLRNKVDLATTPGSMLVFDVDDVTLLFSSTLTTSAGALPVTVSDPTT